MGKHERTLSAVFARPLRTNIAWSDIESLFAHLGGEVTEGAGSRVRVWLNGAAAVFHRPHPQKEAQGYVVRNVRDFLREAGFEPRK